MRRVCIVDVCPYWIESASTVDDTHLAMCIARGKGPVPGRFLLRPTLSLIVRCDERQRLLAVLSTPEDAHVGAVMPWDAGRVNTLWGKRSDLLGDHIGYLKKYFDAFAQIANLFEAAGTEIDDSTMALSMCNCNDGDVPNQIRTMFIFGLEDNARVTAPAAAAGVPFVAGVVIPPPLVPIPEPILAARRKLARTRTPEKTQRGVTLARTAMSLLGQWRWIQRRSDEILPYWQNRKRERETKQYTGINTFAPWVRSGGKFALVDTTALNCRDAVLVTAVAAGLLTHGQLRAAYSAAEVEAGKILGDVLLRVLRKEPYGRWTPGQKQTGQAAYAAYVRIIDQFLIRYWHRVPVSRKHGLIPQPGDLVFLRGMPPAHICVSLGRTWASKKPIDEVASLWDHNNGTFTRARLEDMTPAESDLVYMPCPF